ncbi:MAG: alkaline phosphatase family protein [bacterium]
MRLIIFFLCSIATTAVNAQVNGYSQANAHSHNDYEQKNPFHEAYNEQFGSIEADVHLVDGKLLVGHDNKDLGPSRTLENLYLIPLSQYNDKKRKLQLLIDIKTEAIPTLGRLVEVLKKYPFITKNPLIKIVISGNRPDENNYADYPSYIWFDGRLDKTYTDQQLKKIALLSDSYGKFVNWKNPWPINSADREKIIAAVKKAHDLQKPIRLWASPDFPEAWEEIIRLQIDFINTDKINELSDYLTKRNSSLRLLPYNRIIRSAGEVIRFGNPALENHALDVATLGENGDAIVEDRYGITAININSKKVLHQWRFSEILKFANFMSTYSGIKTFVENGETFIVWGAADKSNGKSSLMIAEWNNGLKNIADIPFDKVSPASNAIPNEIAVSREKDGLYLYVVLNGNNSVQKIEWSSKKTIWTAATGVAPYGICVANNKIFVSNWAGEKATDPTRERAGVPWGLAYTDPVTGATAGGSVTIINSTDGKTIAELQVGLHPNAVKASVDEKFIYVANGSSDNIAVINAMTNKLVETIDVGLMRGKQSFAGSTPNGLELNAENSQLYVSNGLDNAVAVVQLGKNVSSTGKGKSLVLGYIPTEAYPAGLKLINNSLVVANLESDGANVVDSKKKARSIHQELASVSVIPIPDKSMLEAYSHEVAQLNLTNRLDALSLAPRADAPPRPVPERIGEPSVFKHVVYIIKENKTYDQVYGDMKEGRGDSSLCVFGDKITPNMHALARQFGWMDDYNASGKSSAEGHQWTDAGIVSDYVEKNVRAWFRSYPHRQEDALVYNKTGFIWNHALDHGKTVRVYGEACETEYDRQLKWIDLYKDYTSGKKPNWFNKTTIGRLNPIIHPTMPDCDNYVFSDQQRADIFIEDWKKYEAGDSLPNLMVLSLPNDHSAGTSPNFPTPDAMVADNDLAVGRIMEMISKSKYWDSTVVFITQDDSQGGWDHISAYRTVGMVASPYSSGKLVSTHYNQVSMLRTIEQILGIPPMNIMDATSRLMTDCFQSIPNKSVYVARPNNVPLDKMNKPLNALRGKERKLAELSQNELFKEVDGGRDDEMNKVIWFYTKGNKAYPKH